MTLRVSPALAKRLATQIGIRYGHTGVLPTIEHTGVLPTIEHTGVLPTIEQLQAFGDACLREAAERMGEPIAAADGFNKQQAVALAEDCLLATKTPLGLGVAQGTIGALHVCGWLTNDEHGEYLRRIGEGKAMP